MEKYKFSFFQRQLVDVSILKMISPCKFLVKEAPGIYGSEEAKAFSELEEAMDMYYKTYHIEIAELPCCDSVVAVSSDGNNWYRAKVESILETTTGPRVIAYLLDYGKTMNVEKFCVRKPFPRFYDVPFQALEFRLYGIVPCSLIMQPDCTMVYGRIKQWDFAARKFVETIVSLERCAQMKVVRIDGVGVLHGDLLVSIDGQLTSLSKELISNNFAAAESNNETIQESDREEEILFFVENNDQFPIRNFKSHHQKLLEGNGNLFNDQGRKLQGAVGIENCEVAYVSSMQASVRKLKLHQKKQNLSHQTSDQKEGCMTTTKFRANEGNCILKSPGKLSDFGISAEWQSSDSLSAKNESNGGQKPISSIEKLLSIVKKRSEGTVSHLPSSSNPVGNQFLEAYQDKTDFVPTGNSERSLTVYDNKSRFLTSGTTCVAQTSSASGKEELFENDSRSTTITTLDHPVVSERKIESPKVYMTTQGQSKHLELILQSYLRAPVKEFLSESAPVQQVKANKLDHLNSDVYQNKKSVGQSQKIPVADSSDTTHFPKMKSYLSNKSPCKDNRIEIHSNSNQLKPYPSAENHVFKKYLSRLGETSNAGKHATIKRENYEVNSTGCEYILKKDKDVPKSTLPYTATSKKPDSESNSSPEVGTSLADATDKIKGMNILENDINHKNQAAFPESAMISPKRKTVNAHFKTTMDKWEGMLWDNNNLLQIICHGKGVPKPITTITSAGFNTVIFEGLKEMHFPGPLPLQARMWPSVLRGRNVVSVAPPKSGKTFGYLLPLLSHISVPTFYEGLPSSDGPLALILCSSWKQAQNLHDHCRIILDKCNQIKVMVIYGGSCEELQKVQLVNGCDVLIATPSCLLRLLWNDEYKIIDLKRCCHLIIDDGDIVLELFREEILDILREYGCSLQNRKHLAVPNQIIVCCEHWKKGISSFAQNCMPDSLILITSPFEAAVHAHVFTYCHFVSKAQRNSAIVNITDNCNGKRVVICTTDDADAGNIHQFLNHMSIYSILILSSMLHYEVNSLINEWKLLSSSNTVHILILTDNALINAGVTNANCLIQCNLESTSYSDFGLRYGCMKDNYHSPKEQCKNRAKCTSHLLLTDDCINIAPTLVNMLQELPLKIPQKLHAIAEERIKQLEANKSGLCYYLKAYGHCPNKSTCRERHTVSKELAQSAELPKCGKVRVLVCFVIDATHYYVRIIEHNDLSSNCMLSPSSYLDINLKLAEYYRIKDNCIAEDELNVGKICVIERTGSTYHRVRIEEIVHYNCFGKPRRVKLHYLDEGWQELDDAQKLLKISSNLASYPVQVVEVYICQIQPIDKCYEWCPQASTSVHNMIGGKEMTGKIVLTLSCTMWLEPFVRYVQVDKTGIVIKEPNVRVTLVKQGFAMANNTHIKNLYAVCSGIVSLPLKVNQETKPVQNSNVQYAFLELNKNHCVYVSAVQSPDMFFIQRNDRADLINDMQKEIQEWHKRNKLKKLENVQKGIFCIAPFSENHDYYRAHIEEVRRCVSEESDTEVSLFFVDFGDKDVAKKSDLYFIPEQFLLLPFQAIECSMGGISAPQSGWTRDICDTFYFLTVTDNDGQKPYLLKVLRKELSHYTGGHYVVRLWEEGSESHNLSEVLVSRGMAIATDSQGFSENTDDALSSDHNLSDEESKMEFAFYSEILKKSLARIVPKKKKTTSNKVQYITSNSSDSSQKLEVESVPPLEMCTVGYAIPQILWCQKKGFVKISVCLVGVENCETFFGERYILFTTTLNGTKYRFEQDLFESIDSEKSKRKITGQYVELTLVKLKAGIKWPRLTASSRKKPYIRANFDYLDCSSSDEEPSKVVKANPEEIAHFDEPSDEDYSSEDNEAWTEAHYKDNFYSL